MKATSKSNGGNGKRIPTDEERELGARLRAAWGYRNVSLDTIAAALGVSTRSVQRLFAGEADPTPDQIKATIRETGVPAWFIDYGWRPPSTAPDPELAERVDKLEGEMRTVLRILTGRVAGAASEAAEGPEGFEGLGDTK